MNKQTVISLRMQDREVLLLEGLKFFHKEKTRAAVIKNLIRQEAVRQGIVSVEETKNLFLKRRLKK